MFSFKKMVLITLWFFTILFSVNAETTCTLDDEGLYIAFDSNRLLEVYNIDQEAAEIMITKPFSYNELKKIVTPQTILWYNVDNWLIGFKEFKISSSGIQGYAQVNPQDFYSSSYDCTVYSNIDFPKFKIGKNGDITSGKSPELKKIDDENFMSKFAINQFCALTLPKAELIYNGKEYVLNCKTAYVTAAGYNTPYVYIPYGEVTIDNSFKPEPKIYNFKEMKFWSDENTYITINGIKTETEFNEALEIEELGLYFSGSYVFTVKDNGFELRTESNDYEIPLKVINDHFKLAAKKACDELTFHYKLYGFEYECTMPDYSECYEEDSIFTFLNAYISIQNKKIPINYITFNPALHRNDKDPFCEYELTYVNSYGIYLSLLNKNDFLVTAVDYNEYGNYFFATGKLTLPENYYNSNKIEIDYIRFNPDGTFQKDYAINSLGFNLGQIWVSSNTYCSMSNEELSFFDDVKILFPEELHLGSLQPEILSYKKDGSFTASCPRGVNSIFPSITTLLDKVEITKDSIIVAGSCYLPDWIPISKYSNERFNLKTLEIGFDGSIKNMEISSIPEYIQISDEDLEYNVHIDGVSLDFKNGSWYIIAENPVIIADDNVYPIDELCWNLENAN